MTSAMASESSVEGEQWGGGHGVFTYFLLEGLHGRADRPPYDGVVTVGELFDFVGERVKEETQDRQHPHISSDADRGLVLFSDGLNVGRPASRTCAPAGRGCGTARRTNMLARSGGTIFRVHALPA